MKQIFQIGGVFIIGMLLFLTPTQAQNTLQFDSAFVVTTTTSGDPAWTVPNGKYWKVVSAGGNRGNTGNTHFYINGNSGGFWRTLGGASDGDLRYHSQHLPIWFSEGQTFGIGGSSGEYRWASIIQFEQK